MGNVTKLDRDTVQKLGDEFTAAMEEVAHKYGIGVTYKGTRYSDAEATVKFHITPMNLESGVDTKEVRDYKFNAMMEGLPPLGSIIETWDGDRYEILGWNSKARKYNIKVCDVDTGKKFKVNSGFVKSSKVIKEGEVA